MRHDVQMTDMNLATWKVIQYINKLVYKQAYLITKHVNKQMLQSYWTALHCKGFLKLLPAYAFGRDRQVGTRNCMFMSGIHMGSLDNIPLCWHALDRRGQRRLHSRCSGFWHTTRTPTQYTSTRLSLFLNYQQEEAPQKEERKGEGKLWY